MESIKMLMNKEYKLLFEELKKDFDKIDELYYEKFEGWERDSCIWFNEFLEEGLGDYYQEEIFKYEDCDYFVRKLKEKFKSLDRAMEGYKKFEYKKGDFIIYNNSLLFLIDGLKENYFFIKIINIFGNNGSITNDKNIRLATEKEIEIFRKYNLSMSNKYKEFKIIEKELENLTKNYNNELKYF